jgi:hypothetical protein
MTCEHLRPLEEELIARGIAETFRGEPWEMKTREWVYFACVLDLPALRARLALAPCVADHVHRGTHDGSEAGFTCEEHHDAVMGAHPDDARNLPVVR